jgi:hypothetical protein
MRARYKKLAYARRALNHGPVSYGDREFPKAILLPREPVERARYELRRGASESWLWVKPRIVPILVAFAGMLFVLASAEYLSHVHAAMHTIPAFK